GQSFGLNVKLLSPSVHLGPVSGSVDSIGFELRTSKNGGGNLGFIDLNPSFSAPKGIGIAVESPLISGGGYLNMDREAGTFEGVLALKLQTVDLTAIGLIATKLPNNRRGFSMLISISVIFRPGIQLSFGFTLLGVGGMIGINRTIAVDQIRSRLRSGTLENIMFPRDVIKNAPKIIGQLRAIFPPQKKHFIIAPFLRIGWGTPTLIAVDLGVFLEIPFKGRIILIGGVRINLPAPEAPLVAINVDVLGDFNFADRYVRVEGVLRNSKLVGIPLQGGFAFVLSWGSRPQFLLSVGGYHPRYKKPALFPNIARLSAEIKKGKNLMISCEYYQAISSNSFQTGAAARLKAKFGPAKIEGYFSFDALLQFNPFAFEVSMKFGVTVRVKGKRLAGIELSFLLKGPRPWVVNGTAKIKILFFKLKIRIRLQWGGKQRDQRLRTAPTVVLDRLKDALGSTSNWKASLPNARQSAELLRPRSEAEEDWLLVHPAGYLEVRQKVVPLARRIELLGKTVVTGQPIFEITEVKVAGTPVAQSAILAYFSRGQYEELSKAKQLSSPDFERMKAGSRLEGMAATRLSDDLQHLPVDYELEGIDAQRTAR
ncbi:MAG: DUF6603 domain-containing protein, partial [Bacteroidota bacterium]